MWGRLKSNFPMDFPYFLCRQAAAVALYHKLNWNSGRKIFLVLATHVMHEMHIGAIDAGQLINSCWLGGVDMWRGFNSVCFRFAVSINYRSANGTFPQNLINDGPNEHTKLTLKSALSHRQLPELGIGVSLIIQIIVSKPTRRLLTRERSTNFAQSRGFEMQI